MQTLGRLHNGAKVEPRDFAALGFDDQHVGRFASQQIQSLRSRRDIEDVITVLFQQGLHRLGDSRVGFHT